MLFKELIDQLKTVKKDSDINDELVDELINAGIASCLQLTMERQKCREIEALEIARMIMLRHFDMLMVELSGGMQDDLLL